MPSWSERMRHDPALAAFVQGEIARAGIDVHTAKIELAHKDAVIADQIVKIQQLQAQLDPKRKR